MNPVIIRSIIQIPDTYRSPPLANEYRLTTYAGRPRHDLSPRLASKYFKMCQHDILPDADAYIWADGTYTLREGISDWMVAQLGDADIACIQHPARKTVGEEVAFIETAMQAGDQYLLDRYKQEAMRLQYTSYLQAGFPDTQLLCGGLFIRRNRPAINAAFDDWFLQNVKWTIQDQLSLPYILWKHGLTVKVLASTYLYGGPYHTFAGH